MRFNLKSCKSVLALTYSDIRIKSENIREKILLHSSRASQEPRRTRVPVIKKKLCLYLVKASIAQSLTATIKQNCRNSGRSFAGARVDSNFIGILLEIPPYSVPIRFNEYIG